MTLAQEFRENGVIRIERALDGAALKAAEEAYNWSIAHPSPGASNFVTKNSSATFYQDLANPKAPAAYRKMLEDSPAADIAATLWGTPDVWFMYEQVFLKEGGETRRTPWHQDSSYLAIAGRHLAVAWISFDPVPRADALEFVRASHKGPLHNGSRFELGDDTAPLNPAASSSLREARNAACGVRNLSSTRRARRGPMPGVICSASQQSSSS